VYENQPVVNAT